MSSTAAQGNDVPFRRSQVSTFDTCISGQYTEKRESLLRALKYIDDINVFYLEEGQEKPTANKISMARFFIEKLPRNKEAADEIILSGEGDLIFKWKTESHKIMTTIDGKALHFSSKINNGETVFEDDITFFETKNTRIPRTLLEKIPNRW
jgi:hypothetical protein